MRALLQGMEVRLENKLQGVELHLEKKLQDVELRLGNKLQDVELRFEKKLQVLDTRIEAVGDEAKLARAESRQMGVELRAHIDWHISHLRDTIAGRFEVFDAR